ncbi:MAG: TIGR03279 family radical SAM protein [Microcystis sp. M048S1]|uniref:TIGR03279 family radical SAM protein n=1 Tax=unclassified Microcystis TaxID=2643300 RepID=UPI001195EE2E|nr:MULTISPECIES: TIGR03279 family radical SAM protein [unclassified Microcystis]MCA2902504.1 TIGR03279 family radical SAM protein [Microcystis sp. M035S1]MCA2721094.1 TIGR03279 family radical SAM protein [Microcystis sp. M176S2]MCA2724655.1 TIGR03279 family radical SAM protein [Microcystis sp. M166S2]MCA2731766.1 TIGR03279 family radical SAM protein [Microcystis sp. M162S2]MCA2746610.1 TIGR03279 family radical SAM protein [Microcystis sp. M155S2]
MSELTIRPAKITGVIPDSIAAEVGFEIGDALVSINGNRPRDLIDYQFLCADEFLTLEVLDSQGKNHRIEIEKDYHEDLGLEFETALFDGLIQCNNKCPFCFIDQQPEGKRETLYYKDDDYRLSFLYGSYLTLTNLTSKEWQRIEKMHISPLFVSVHATEPDLRIRLLKNPRAGQILDHLKWLQARQLQIHAQVVVCPNINDGIHLERTLLDLVSFHRGDIPCVESIAVVPVGLTRFRPQEDELIPVSQEKAREVIEQVQTLQKQFRQEFGSNVVWLADEWFLIARVDLPPQSHYEDYPQIGNGVGSIRQFIRDFQKTAKKLLPAQITPSRRLVWVVGNAVEQAFQPLVKQLNNLRGLTVELVALNSDYWGQEITVTGLLTGQDILKGLQGKNLGDGVLLPSLMLKHGESVFLDDFTLETVINQLGVPIYPVLGVEELIKTCLTLNPLNRS